MQIRSLEGGGGRESTAVVGDKWMVDHVFWGGKLLSTHTTRYSYFQKLLVSGFNFVFGFAGICSSFLKAASHEDTNPT